MTETSQQDDCLAARVCVCAHVHSHFIWQRLKTWCLIKQLFAIDTAAEQKMSERVTDAL